MTDQQGDADMEKGKCIWRTGKAFLVDAEKYFLLHSIKEAFRASPIQWKVTKLIQGYRETWSSEWKPEEVVFHSKGKAEKLLCFNITMMEKPGKKCHRR